MISKIGECAVWALFMIGFGSVVYKVNFMIGVIYTVTMTTLWILLLFAKDEKDEKNKEVC